MLNSVGATTASFKKGRRLVQKIKTEAKFSNRAKVLFKGMQGARAVVLCTGGRQKNILDTIGDEEGLHRSEDCYSEILLLFKYFNIVHHQSLTRPYCPSHIG